MVNKKTFCRRLIIVPALVFGIILAGCASRPDAADEGSPAGRNQGRQKRLDFDYLGGADKNIAKFTEAIRLNPNIDMAYTWRADAYYRKGDYTRARADAEKVLQIDPNNTTAQKNLEFLREQGY